MKLKVKLVLCSLFIFIDVFAQVKDFAFKRELKGINNQWHSITLPNDIFKDLNADFSDIRVYGFAKGDTIEAPYILKVLNDETKNSDVAFKIINQSKVANGFYYTFLLDKEEAINNIKLSFKNDNFDYAINLEGSQDQNQWFYILEKYRILSIKNNLSNYRFTELSFPFSKFKYFRLFVPTDKNPDLSSADLSLNEIKEGESLIHKIESFKIEQDKKNKQTFIYADLTQTVPINSLKIFVKSNFDFYRSFSIDYVTDSIKTEKGWIFNYSSLYNGNLNSLEKAEFKFKSTVFKKLKITIENQDNQPLQIDSISTSGYVHKLLVRFDKPADYFLVYGNKNASQPQYDIAQFEEKIPLAMTSLTLGEVTSISKNDSEKSQPLFLNKTWLWVILGLIILLMGWFTLKMMSKK